MIKYLVLFLVATLPLKAGAQEYTFIGELLFNLDDSKPSTKLPQSRQLSFTSFSQFQQFFYIKVYDEKTGNELNTKLSAKEEYYDDKENHRVEIRIKVPASQMPGTELKVIAKFFKKNGNKFMGNSQYFTLTIQEKTKEAYINASTFKLSEKVRIGSPAQVGLTLMLQYLKNIIDSNTVYGFKNTVTVLEKQVTGAGNNLSYIDSTLLKEYYRLYAFIEPYIPATAFYNTEARELAEEINLIKNGQHLPGADSLDKEAYDLVLMDSLYKEYALFSKRIAYYYQQLELILFSKRICPDTPSQAIKYRPIKTHKISFSTGLSVFHLTQPVYDVKISEADTTVKFNPASMIIPAFSAGILLRLFSKKKLDKKYNSGNSVTKTKVSSGFTAGFFVNCYISPEKPLDFSLLTFGPGMAVGYSGNRLGIFASLAFITSREPQPFFTKGYNELNKKLPDASNPFIARQSLSIDDDNFFMDKWIPAAGISIIFSFGKSSILPFTGNQPPLNINKAAVEY
jgi:hypothetical protein